MHSASQNLRGLVRQQSGLYSAAVLAEGLASFFLFATPWLIKLAIDVLGEAPLTTENSLLLALQDALTGGTTAETLWRIAGAIALCSLVGGVLLFARVLWAATASERITRSLRDSLFRHVERLPMPWHDEAETGDIVQRCSSDVETVRMFLSTQIVEIGRAAILLGLLIPALFALDRQMALVSMALFPPIVLFALLYFRLVRRDFLAMDEAEGRMTAVLQENLTGIRVVRAFAQQDFEKKKFGAASREFRFRNKRFVDSLATFWSVSDLMCFSQLGLVMVVGALRLDSGTLTAGSFFAIFNYVWMVIWPVRHMGRVLAETGKATVAMGRIREVLQAPAEEPEPTGQGRLQGAIEFEDVHFTYTATGDEVVCPSLRGVSFRIEPGQVLALIGPPGAGKSTIVRLLTRLYEGYEGSIRIDGRELRSIARHELRGAIATVLQQPFLFARTVRENLAIGAPHQTSSELEEAARIAALHDSIESFEEGYGTLLGERGVTLSGGQRQRLAIARAIAKPAPILVLDDSLSAVDAHTEEEILQALETQTRERTTIVIAHRVSTIRSADLILVLEDGQVMEAGSHAELVRQAGRYAHLVRMQGLARDDSQAWQEV